MEEEEEENAGHAEVPTINNGTAPKEKESLEDLKAEENGEKDSKERKDTKERKEMDVLIVEIRGTMQESAHTRKEKEKEDPLMNLQKETTKRRRKSQR